MGASTIDLAHLPINPVGKVVWEPMKALNQLDVATDDFIMEDNSNYAPPSLNSPISVGSRPPPLLCSPLSFRQLRTVPKKTSNDERQGNDAMGVHVPEEEAMVVPGVVAFSAAQENEVDSLTVGFLQDSSQVLPSECEG